MTRAATQTASPTGEDVFFTELPVVLSVSRLAQPASEAPGAVTVIDREMIHASGARSVAELMRLVPGFQITPATQDAPRVTYHGLGDTYSPRVQVLVDGRSLYSPFYVGGVNWNLMPVALEDIERIEVVRGSNSVAYGANAFLGVVNIITQTPEANRGFSLSVQSGSQGVEDHTYRWSGGNERASLRATYQDRRDYGTDALYDDLRTRLVDFRTDMNVSDRDEVQLSLGSVEIGLGQGLPDHVENPLRTMRQGSAYAQAQWRHTLSAQEDVTLKAHYTQEDSSDPFTVSYYGKQVQVNGGGRASRLHLELQHSLSPGPETRVVWGLSHTTDTVYRSQNFYGGDQSRQSSRAFANLEWRPREDWIVNAGSSLEHDSISGGMTAPRLSVSYHLTPEHTLRAAVSRAFRIPSLYEARGDMRFVTTDGTLTDRRYTALINPAPERVDTREISYLGEWKKLAMSLDVRLFAEHIPNRIQQEPIALRPPNCDAVISFSFPCGSTDYSVNAESVHIRGLEYQWRWQPWSGTRFLVNQAYTRIRSELLDFVASDSASNYNRMIVQTEGSAPSRSTTLMWMQQLPYGVDFSATYSSVGAIRWTRNTVTDPYHRLDWRLAYPFRMGARRGEVAYTQRADSAVHSEYRSDAPVTPRHFVTLQLDF